ncbi:MAG: DUF4139 domain-containing protein [Burkholderiaceae bacterium]
MTKCGFALILGALPGLALAQNPSRIEQVRVYPGGATVERVLAVKAGTLSLKIPCLPARLDADSLQIQAAGEASGISLGDISVQTVERAAAPECANSALDGRIRELEEQIAALAAETGAHDLTLGYLKNYGGGAANVAPAQIAATGETLRRSGLDTLQRQGQLQRKKDALERQLAPLVAERDKLASANPQLRSVSLRLAALRDGELRISYRLGQAGWEPVYRAYLDTETGGVRLERHAQVAQSSGEDWRDVRLRLSTAQPRPATGMPAPGSGTLDLLPPPGAESRAAAVAYAPAPAPVAMSVTGSRSRGDDVSFDISVFQGEFATEFELPGKVSVASDGQRVALALGSVPLEAKLMARSNPRVDASAYLVAESARPAGVWPAGNLQLFRDGAFVGQSRLNLGNPERLDLYFGRDELLRVSMEPEQRNAGDAGFISSRIERRLGRAYRVENLHQRAITVQLLESAPVARHEDIKVQALFNPKPSEENWRKQPGINAWLLPLEPGQAQRVTADYVISYPKDGRISGLR